MKGFNRIFTIMTLAATMSSGALAEKAKVAKNTNSNDANCETAPASYNKDEQKADQTDLNQDQPDSSQNKSRRQQQIEQQNKQWLHDLQGIYGG